MSSGSVHCGFGRQAEIFLRKFLSPSSGQKIGRRIFCHKNGGCIFIRNFGATQKRIIFRN
jgi:hypothetical protein